MVGRNTILYTLVLSVLSIHSSSSFLATSSVSKSVTGSSFIADSKVCSFGNVEFRSHRQCAKPLRMGLDLVTYLRTEWISTSLCTNQTPRSAKVVLQLGSEDGRAVTMIPRTVEKLITSSAEPDGKIPVSVERQLRQQAERRGAAKVRVVNQAADNLSETEDESVDVVISLQAAERMQENGLSWINSVREAARVLKPGGRFLFVEKTTIGEIDYIDCVMGITGFKDEVQQNPGDEPATKKRIFEMVGFDEVDMVLVPHIAGVVVKSDEAGLTESEVEAKQASAESDRLAELSINAFERGLKKRRKKKKNKDEEEAE